MLNYLDKTFCNSNCVNKDCHRLITESVVQGAEAIGLPIAKTDFSSTCVAYKAMKYHTLSEALDTIPLLSHRTFKAGVELAETYARWLTLDNARLASRHKGKEFRLKSESTLGVTYITIWRVA